MSYALYILGFIILIAGLALAAQALGVPNTWIVIGIIIVVGIAVISIASNMQERNPRG